MIDEHLMDILFRIWQHGFATNSFAHGGGWEAQATHLIGGRTRVATGLTERAAFLALADLLGVPVDGPEIEFETFGHVAA